MIVYLDTSAVLRILFRQPNPLVQWRQWERAYSSELMGVEARRVIDRLRLEQALEDAGVAQAQEDLAAIEGAIGRIPLTRPVLQRASMPMATAVKTLDAIHLATALLFKERRAGDLIFATHDEQQAIAARGLGFSCVGI
jgi:predicted nucleic acid-binding protein